MCEERASLPSGMDEEFKTMRTLTDSWDTNYEYNRSLDSEGFESWISEETISQGETKNGPLNSYSRQ